jgi:predicted DNA binding protein
MDTILASDEILIHYASVHDASLDALREFIEDRTDATQFREIRRTEDSAGGVVEIKLHRGSLAQELIEYGAKVLTDRVTDGQAEIVCEIPSKSDISAIVTHVRNSFPQTSLVTKQEYKRSTKSTDQSVNEVLGSVIQEELTDRQHQVLRAAMYSGYFKSPRQSTATEIANSLSLTQSTFSYHLRTAQQTLFKGLFDQLHI